MPEVRERIRLRVLSPVLNAIWDTIDEPIRERLDVTVWEAIVKRVWNTRNTWDSIEEKRVVEEIDK